MKSYSTVVVSTRIRLARNFAEYPFPNQLTDPETAEEMIDILEAELNRLETFKLYRMDDVSPLEEKYLLEKKLISRDLLRHRAISAAFVSEDESISVMVNEEDHLREQYFVKEYDLAKAYERISGIDDLISESIPFAYHSGLGYLTACPTNLGTGMRASVMLFLPALTRQGHIEQLKPILADHGLTIRGGEGEGSAFTGDLYQISNEVTLGKSEDETISMVESAVTEIAQFEIRERREVIHHSGLDVQDESLRAFGVLTNCKRLSEREFVELVSKVKFGVALGFFEGGMTVSDLDNAVVSFMTANLSKSKGVALTTEACEIMRAELVGEFLRSGNIWVRR